MKTTAQSLRTLFAAAFFSSLFLQSYSQGKAPEDFDSQFQEMYVVIAATGSDYGDLRQQMFQISQNTGIGIDTLDRTWNAQKELIALPEDYEDDIYQGSYYPRRFPDEFLSLEYLNFYENKAPEKTIALVAGIYDDKSAAKGLLKRMKKFSPGSKVVKAEVYVGCMH
jgi:hypothetical protein